MAATAGIQYNVGVQTSQATAALSRLRGALSQLGGIASRVIAPLAGIAGAGGAIGLSFAGISKAANLETLRTAFVPLLGSADAAQARIAELSQFAASTPFEMPEVANASKVLETLTRGALSTGKGLTLVGDVASATGQPFDAMATTIGRLYDGIQSGRPVGEVMQRLQELGAISGDARAKIEQLSASGRNTEAWEAAQAALARFSGSMAAQSGTWNGLMSTLRDNIGMALAAFGEPIIDAVKPYLQSLIAYTGTLMEAAKAFGAQVAQVLEFLAAAFSAGELGTIIGSSIILSFQNAVNFLWKALQGIGSAIGEYFVQAAKSFALAISIVTKADFWKGIGSMLQSFALGFTAKLLEALNFLQGGVIGFLRKVGATDLADSLQGSLDAREQTAAVIQSRADAKSQEGADTLNPFFDSVLSNFQTALSSIGNAFSEGMANAPDLIDTSAQQQVLDDALANVFAEIDRARKTAEETKAKTNPAAAATPDPSASAMDTAQMEKATASTMKADRLAQIGGFVGAASTTRPLEDTAKATAETAKHTRKIADYVSKPPLKELGVF